MADTASDRFGVRPRSVVAATLVVALAYALGSVIFVALIQRSLLANIDGAALALASGIADEIADSGFPVSDELDDNASRSQIVQVLDASGHLLATSSAAYSTPFTDLDAANGAVARSPTSRLELLDRDHPSSIVVVGTEHRRQHYRVVVETVTEGQRDSIRSVVGYLVLGFPLVLTLVALVTWRLVGRALAPVDRMRAEVERMSARHLQERLRVPRSRDEVARLAATMNRLLDRLEASQAEQRQFVADASHELRSPLTTVVTALELGENDPDTWSDLYPVVQGEIERLRVLVSDLLTLARADELGVGRDVGDVDLDDLLAAEAIRLRTSGRVVVHTKLTAVRVQGDRFGLSQVARNLVDNAARAADSTVELSVGRTGGFGVIRIDDDGPGIAPDDRERVFRRFARLDDSRERTRGGTGIGLAIVLRIVEAHAGTITVTASPLGGARFELRLPMREGSSTVAADPDDLEVSAQPPAPSSR